MKQRTPPQCRSRVQMDGPNHHEAIFFYKHLEQENSRCENRRNPSKIIAGADFWTQSSQSKFWHVTRFIIHSFTHSLTACGTTEEVMPGLKNWVESNA